MDAERNYRDALDVLANFSRSTNGAGGKRYASREEYAEVRRIYNNARSLVRGKQLGWRRDDAVKRARRKGLGGAPSTSESRQLYRLAKDPDAIVHCFWCRQLVPVIFRVVDHVMPIAKGGSNHHTNLTIACRRCNSAKRDLLPEQFIFEVLPKL